jgi:hypothetical protein
MHMLVVVTPMPVYTLVTVREHSGAVMFDVCSYAGVVMTDRGGLWSDGRGERDLQRYAQSCQSSSQPAHEASAGWIGVLGGFGWMDWLDWLSRARLAGLA